MGSIARLGVACSVDRSTLHLQLEFNLFISLPFITSPGSMAYIPEYIAHTMPLFNLGLSVWETGRSEEIGDLIQRPRRTTRARYPRPQMLLHELFPTLENFRNPRPMTMSRST